MRNSHVRLSSVVVVLFGITSLWGGQALAGGFGWHDEDKVVCYVSGDEVQTLIENGFETWTLNVKKHSPLDFDKKKRYRHHSKQTTYSVVGKSTIFDPFCRNNVAECFVDELSLMNSVYGGAITHKYKGARMALTRAGILSATIISATAREVFSPMQHVECQSSDESATPDKWNCGSVSGGQFISSFTLHRVDPYKADEHLREACDYFQGTIQDVSEADEVNPE